MNIFVLDDSPFESAEHLCDKHVVKMVLESAQLLSTAHRILDGDASADAAGLYRKTHANHPCSVWARESSGNHLWLCCHAMWLVEEYKLRYEKTHKSKPVIEWCTNNSPKNLPDLEMTPFAQAMPQDFRGDSAVDAYRRYYHHKKDVMDMRWTNRDPPDWMG